MHEYAKIDSSSSNCFEVTAKQINSKRFNLKTNVKDIDKLFEVRGRTYIVNFQTHAKNDAFGAIEKESNSDSFALKKDVRVHRLCLMFDGFSFIC